VLFVIRIELFLKVSVLFLANTFCEYASCVSKLEYYVCCVTAIQRQYESVDKSESWLQAIIASEYLSE
jgi:hypothetical protein